MGMDEVEALAPQQCSQSPGGGEVLVAAGREAEEIDLDPVSANLVDLVEHPAPPLRRRVIGHEVGDDEDAHRRRVFAIGGGEMAG